MTYITTYRFLLLSVAFFNTQVQGVSIECQQDDQREVQQLAQVEGGLNTIPNISSNSVEEDYVVPVDEIDWCDRFCLDDNSPDK